MQFLIVFKLNIKLVGKEEFPMSVKKIFIILITVVACVMLGALILNILMPNVMTSVVDSVENMVYNATGMKMDFNGNGTGAGSGKTAKARQVSDNEGAGSKEAVNGFKQGMQ